MSSARSLLLLMFGVGVCQLAGCGACTLIGCDGAVRFALSVDAPFAPETALAATCTMCHNGECLSGGFPAGTEAPAVGTGWGVTFPSGPEAMSQRPNASVTLWSSSAGRYWLEFVFRAKRGEGANGDLYQATAVGPQNEPLLDVTRTATYQAFTPNGVRCGPSCLSASVDLRAPGS